jgi:peptide/nickel transport system substrate-binding protein
MSRDSTRGHRAVRGRSTIAAMAIGIVLAIVAAACGGGTGSSGGGGGKTIRYGYDATAQFTNTFDVSQSKGDCDMVPYFQIYDSLMHWDGVKFTPGLALGYTFGKRTITLKLRPNITFQDGEKFDSTAVKEGLDQNHKNSMLDSLDHIASIDTPDPLTLVIHTKDDKLTYVSGAFGNREGMIMAPNSYKTAGTHPIGAGPFKFVSWSPGGSIVLKRWPGYWNKDSYKFDSLDFVPVGTGSPAITALETNTADIARIETDGISPVEKNKALGLASQITSAYLQMQFRLGKPGAPNFFNNVKVRQAVSYAIDKTKINERVQGGQGEVASQPFLKSSPAWQQSLSNLYPYDAAKARELLKEAGYPNGFSFDMVIPGEVDSMQTQGALVQDMLKNVGINAKIVKVLGSDIATQYYISGTGDAFVAAILGSKNLDGQIHDSYAEFQFVPTYNHAERQDITDLSDQVEALNGNPKEIPLVKQMSDIVMKNALEIPIAFMPQAAGYQKATIGGIVKAQTNVCDPPDLSQVTVK